MSKKRHKIKEHELQGFKYFKAIAGMLEGLHDAGCYRDKAGNRTLHMDQYMSLLLLYMFNPICTSLRAIQQASELKKVQRKLGCSRASLGSLSESARVFDSELMQEIIKDLGEQLEPISHHAKLDDLTAIITAVDGTLLKALPKLAYSLWATAPANAIKAHTQFDIQKHIPVKITITECYKDERQILADNLESGRIYVQDRGYASCALFQQILDNHSSFVCRLKESTAYECLEKFELTGDALAAGIIFDKKVRLGGADITKNKLSVSVRLIAIKCTPHKKRNKKTGHGGPETLLITTDRFDLEADVIALIFKHRWAIEIFFRFFKHVLGCRHLLSYDQNGIELQTYAAIIACMLIALWTGRKPTLRTYEMLCWYFTGMADEEELLAHIARLQKQD